jgi:hypothetical protein
MRALALIVLAGCSAGDPCDDHRGVCISLTVNGSLSGIDQLAVTVDQPMSETRTTPTMSFTLPAQIGLNLPSSVTGVVNIGVVALAKSAPIGEGSGQATITNGHGRASVTLVAAGSPDLSTNADLAGVDFSGADLVTVAAADLTSGSSVPGPPTNVVAQGGVAQATITWDPPVDTGGSPITAYLVTSSGGGSTMTVNGAVTMATMTGLTNGTTYTFMVAAINAAGTGPSATSNPTTPTGMPMAPSAPTNVSAIANVDHGATVSWTASDNHGSPLQGYAIAATQLTGTLATASPTATSAMVTGLTLGQQYTFTVTATNGIGTSSASLPSMPVTAATKPNAAPTNVSGVSDFDHGITVTWTAAVNGSFSPITRYTVTTSPGGASIATPDGTTTSAKVMGLAAGAQYTFKVFASNLIGDGPSSGPSASVTACNSTATPEDCFNDYDDNCDGLIDCNDPTCNGIATCVPVYGGFAFGTILSGTPSCPQPGATATPLYNNFGSSSTSCTGCSCDTSGESCGGMLYHDPQFPMCVAGNPPATTKPLSLSQSCSSFNVQPEDMVTTNCNCMGTPSIHQGTLTLPASTTLTNEFCATTLLSINSCPGGQVCVPSTGANQQCVMGDSPSGCPTGYSAPTTWNTGVNDGRSCDSCTLLSSTCYVALWGNTVSCVPGTTNNAYPAQDGQSICANLFMSAPLDEASVVPSCTVNSNVSGMVTGTGSTKVVCCR